MEKYFIKAVRHYYWRKGHYNRLGHHNSNPFGGYYIDYVTIHNGKLTKLGFVYPYVANGYKLCLYCDDIIIMSGCKFIRLGVIKSSKHYPTFNIDNDGMINEICIYIDSTIISDKCVTDGIVELYYYQLPSMLLSPNYNCGYDFHIRNKKGTAIPLVPMVKKIGVKYDNLFPDELDYILDKIYTNLYSYICNYYDKFGSTDINELLNKYVKDYVTKIQTKRNNIPRDMFYYFPVLKRRMFMFNGGVNHFDFVTVMIPLANPGGGNLVKIIEKYKKPMFYLIYSELESISGISKNFFKIDNCTLTKDNRLVFKFSLKEHPTEEKEA